MSGGGGGSCVGLGPRIPLVTFCVCLSCFESLEQTSQQPRRPENAARLVEFLPSTHEALVSVPHYHISRRRVPVIFDRRRQKELKYETFEDCTI